MAKYVSKYTGEEIESILDKSTISYIKPNDGIPKSDLSSSIQTSLNNISNKVDKVSGKQLSTEDFTTALKNKLNSLSNYDDTTVNNAISGLQSQINTLVNSDASTAIESFNEIIAFLNGVTDSQSLDSIIASIEQQIAGKMDTVTLAKVATSGSYSDLTNKPTIPAEQVNADWNATSGKAQILNKPTIPSAVTESTVSGWGFTKNTGTYSKPSTGIPKTDLASAVQTSLGKADTALQSYTEQYKGTITGIRMNGVSKGTSGVVDLGTVIIAHQDISGKQDKLVSGTNIKTVNGTSLLGSGNIVINGGGGDSGGSSAYSEVNHGTSDTTFTLTPNAFHVWDEVATLDLSFGTETGGVANEYLFQFTSGSTATTLTLPDDIKWANDTAPIIAENMIYQISILKGLASVLEFRNAAALIENKATMTSTSKGEVQFQYPVASTIVVGVRSDMNYQLTFNEGDQTKSVGELSIEGYIITSINPDKDGIYNYTF